MADSNKRKYSRPVITKTLVMNSEASLKALDSYINKTLSNLYALDVILYIIGNDDAAEAANEEVKSIFDKKIEQFNKEFNKYKPMIEELDLNAADYPEGMQKEFKIYCPLGAVYLRMISKFELVTNQVDTIWINGEMPSRERKKKVKAMSDHMRNVSAQVSNISKRAMIAAKAEGKGAEAAQKMKELEINSDVETEEVKAKATKAKATKAKATEVKELSLMELIEKEKSEKNTEKLKKEA